MGLFIWIFTGSLLATPSQGVEFLEKAKGSFPGREVKVLRVASGICPQSRKTRRAPRSIYQQLNPLAPTPENIERGRTLYHQLAKPNPCKVCHGIRGNGNGRLAPGLNPPPRNFTCAEIMNDLPDGQLFWIIKNGSRGTAMPAHEETLKPEDIWHLILYIRQFAK